MRPSRRRCFFVALPALLAAALPAQSKPLPADRARGVESVTLAHTKEWLGQLASEEFGGRGTGQDGFRLAADYVALHFKTLGLEPRGDDGSCFQKVPWGGGKVDADATFVAFHKDGKEVLRIPATRLAGNVSKSVTANGDAVLLLLTPPAGSDTRRGEPAPIPGLADLDLIGKIALVHLRSSDDDGRRQQMARFQVLSQLAGKKLEAVLFVDVDAPTGELAARSGPGRGAGRAAAGAGVMPASVDFGGADLEALLTAAGKDLTALAGKEPLLALPLTADLQLTVKEENLPACNVVGVLPGSDPKLKDEYVVIGSHLDHLGRRGRTFYPGADDDGSGTTGVMAVAQMFANNPTRPRRSVLFVCFCGEENGLIGSRFFSDNPPIPLAAIAGELQMDMIGRDKEENAEGNKGAKAEDHRNTLHLIGTEKLSRDLHALCMQKNAAAAFDLEWDMEGMFSRSDHANFARMGVPIAFFFTGLHRDYHRPTDTPDKIHYEKLLRVATYVYDIAFELAKSDARPLVDQDLWDKNRASVRGVATPAAPVRPADK